MNAEELKMAAPMLARMFAAFPQSPSVDAHDQVKAYLYATADYPLADLEESVQRFMKGEVEKANPAFCPSAAELAIDTRQRGVYRKLRAEKADREKAGTNVVKLGGPRK